MTTTSRTKTATTATDGRKIGERAQATRRRLLDATHRLLGQDGLADLRLVDITREVDASPATFYQYFTDLDAALLALSEEAGEDTPELLAALEAPWTNKSDFEQAQGFVAAWLAHWENHGPVLRVRNLKAEENVTEFRRSRQRGMKAIIDRLAAMTRLSIEAGRLPADTDAIATASAILAMLERLTAYQVELGRRGTTAESLANTLALIAFQLVSGRKP